MDKKMRFTHIPKWITYALVTCAALGLIDALYLTISHYQNSVPTCLIGSCEIVLTSQYSLLFGVPVALLGALYYFVMLALLVIRIESKNAVLRERVFAYALWTSIVGFLASCYFFIIQASVLHAFCQYCLGSATTSTLLFVISMYVLGKYRLPVGDSLIDQSSNSSKVN